MDALILFFGILFSSFYGFNAVQIFQRNNKKINYADHDYVWSWWLHQFWINFICSLLGWVGVYYVVHYKLWGDGIGVEELLLIIASLIGIIGALPRMLFGANLSIGN